MEKILNAHDNGTDPYFIRNNFKAINAILNPDEEPQEKVKEEKTEAQFTKEEKEFIEKWPERESEFKRVIHNPEYEDVEFNIENGGLKATQKYKVNNPPSYNAIDRLIRDGAKQSKNIVLKLESDISLEILSKALNDRVKRTTIKTVQIIKGNEWVEFSREEITKDSFFIQQQDFI